MITVIVGSVILVSKIGTSNISEFKSILPSCSIIIIFTFRKAGLHKRCSCIYGCDCNGNCNCI